MDARSLAGMSSAALPDEIRTSSEAALGCLALKTHRAVSAHAIAHHSDTNVAFTASKSVSNSGSRPSVRFTHGSGPVGYLAAV